jgi:hypothetical protein
VELVSLNLECLWDPTITGIGRRRGLQRTAPSGGSHRVLSPVVVGSASKRESVGRVQARVASVTRIVIYESTLAL